MLNVAEILRNRKEEIAAEIVSLTNERVKIEHALDALEDNNGNLQPPAKKEDAVVEAVKRGHKRPVEIHKFLERKLGVEMGLGSVRSTLSRLKSENRIRHDASGWVM